MSLSEVRDYKVQERIGRGSFGEVFLVIHKQSRKHFVLKRVRLARQNEWQRAASHLEMFLAKQLWHPFIVPHVESWLDRGHTIHLVHEYCINGDLHSLLQRLKGKSIPEEQLKLWLAQSLLALDYLHGHGIVHRDLKLSNLFLNDDGDVLVGDFGLAAFRRGAANEDNSLVGTPQYMSPELLTSDCYGLPTDIWSLGCCLWELTAGRPAFQAFNFDGLVAKITKGQAGGLPPQYSESWATLLRGMLVKNPDRRSNISSLLEAPCMRSAVRDATARCRLLAKSMGIDELPPICRTPRIEEMEAEADTHSVGLSAAGNRHGEESEDPPPLTSRSGPSNSQSIIQDLIAAPVDPKYAGQALSPLAHQKAVHAGPGQLSEISRQWHMPGDNPDISEGNDGELYLSPSDAAPQFTSTDVVDDPPLILSMESSDFQYSADPHSIPSGVAMGPTSNANSIEPLVRPLVMEHSGIVALAQAPMNTAKSAFTEALFYNHQPGTMPVASRDESHGAGMQPQRTMQTGVTVGPPTTDAGPQSHAPHAISAEEGPARSTRSTHSDSHPPGSLHPIQRDSKASHMREASVEQDSFAGKATVQWQNTRPGRGAATDTTTGARRQGRDGRKTTTATAEPQTKGSGVARKMLRSASDACARLAEAATVSSRERRQRSRSQAPTPSAPFVPGGGRQRRVTQTGGAATMKTARDKDSRISSALPARGAATVGNNLGKGNVPGSVEIRIQQRAMRDFSGGRRASRDPRNNATKPADSSKADSRVDGKRARSRTVTPRAGRPSYGRASALHTAPPQQTSDNSSGRRAATARSRKTGDDGRASDSGNGTPSDTERHPTHTQQSAASDSEASRQMMIMSAQSEPGPAVSSFHQAELSLMNAPVPSPPPGSQEDIVYGYQGTVMPNSEPSPQDKAAIQQYWGQYQQGAGAPVNPVGLQDTNAAMDYAGFDGGNSLFTIADMSGLVTPGTSVAATPLAIHERKLSAAPSSEESWVDMISAPSRTSSRVGSGPPSGQGILQPGWGVTPAALAPGREDAATSVTPTHLGSLSPLGQNLVLPSAGTQLPAVGGARAPLDSDEHMRMHEEQSQKPHDATRTNSGSDSPVNKGARPSANGQGTLSMEEALAVAVADALKLLQEKQYGTAEAVLEAAHKRYARKKSMLERFETNAKQNVRASAAVSKSRVQASATVGGAAATRRTLRRSPSAGPSGQPSNIDTRPKRRGSSTTRGVSPARPEARGRGRLSGRGNGASTVTNAKAPGRRVSGGRLSATQAAPERTAGDVKGGSAHQTVMAGPAGTLGPASTIQIDRLEQRQGPSAGPSSSESSTTGSTGAAGDRLFNEFSKVRAAEAMAMSTSGTGPSSLPPELNAMSERLSSLPHRGPVSASDDGAARVGDVVRVGKVRAVVRFVGPVKGLSQGPWVGLELSHPCGTGTGTINGVEYFKCAPQCGAFVALEKLMPDNDAYSTDI